MSDGDGDEGARAGRPATWYFDFISPFAYLQLKQFSRLPTDLEIECVPVLFAGLLEHWGQLGPAEIPAKRVQTYRICHWQAKRLGVPFRMPPAHPFLPLVPLRLCIALGPSRENVEAIFDFLWAQGGDVSDAAAVARFAAELGVEDVDEACSRPDVKAGLRERTQAAAETGVYGVPTFEVDGELFWGADATDLLLDFLVDRDLFEDEEMRRISNLPIGTERPRSR